MINAVTEAVSRKTINQYMIIEDNYLTLKRYLRLLIEESKKDISNIDRINRRDIEHILTALDDSPIETDETRDKDVD